MSLCRETTTPNLEENCIWRGCRDTDARMSQHWAFITSREQDSNKKTTCSSLLRMLRHQISKVAISLLIVVKDLRPLLRMLLHQLVNVMTSRILEPWLCHCHRCCDTDVWWSEKHYRVSFMSNTNTSHPIHSKGIFFSSFKVESWMY